MLNNYLVCKQISILYYIFGNRFGTILKFRCQKHFTSVKSS